ncbi:hypothetical protein ACHQM5_015379 [Ranunculus cassubicifolius]
MDSFFIDNVKAEKAIAMKRYQRFRKIADALRYVFEICVVLMLFAWISTRLPSTLCDIFRDFSSLFVSPRFMFVVGNAIILTLFAKSGQFSGENSGTGNFSGTELYDEFVKNSVSRDKIAPEISSPVPEITINEEASPPSVKEEMKVYEDKQILMEENCSKIISNSNPEIDIGTVPSNNVAVTAKQSKKYQRSQSEKTKQKEKPKQKELRRWKTERSREEEMSNEEFNRTIEAFIAKQVKFIREESMAIVTQN